MSDYKAFVNIKQFTTLLSFLKSAEYNENYFILGVDTGDVELKKIRIIKNCINLIGDKCYYKTVNKDNSHTFLCNIKYIKYFDDNGEDKTCYLVQI